MCRFCTTFKIQTARLLVRWHMSASSSSARFFKCIGIFLGGERFLMFSQDRLRPSSNEIHKMLIVCFSINSKDYFNNVKSKPPSFFTSSLVWVLGRAMSRHPVSRQRISLHPIARHPISRHLIARQRISRHPIFQWFHPIFQWFPEIKRRAAPPAHDSSPLMSLRTWPDFRM